MSQRIRGLANANVVLRSSVANGLDSMIDEVGTIIYGFSLKSITAEGRTFYTGVQGEVVHEKIRPSFPVAVQAYFCP